MEKLKIPGYEEISEEEWEKIPRIETAIFKTDDSKEFHYFKKVQKFPIDFYISSNRRMVVRSIGEVNFMKDDSIVFTVYPNEIPALVKAVEKAKEVIKSQ